MRDPSDPRMGGAGSLRHDDFDRLAGVIERHCGIRLPPAKRTMVEGRLLRRVRELGYQHIGEYCRYLFEGGGLGSELGQLVDALTTHKTDFFREPAHFDFLVAEALPALVRRRQRLAHRPLMVWSAGCSSGPEPYSLAMVLDDLAARLPGLEYRILASDVSRSVLEEGVRAVYAEDLVAPVPEPLRRRYLLRSRDRSRRLVRVAPELRERVSFYQLNLLDDAYPWEWAMDIIFCRNVLIYFDAAVRAQVLARLCRHLAAGGYLFLGHSEGIGNVALPLRAVAPSVYVRQ